MAIRLGTEVDWFDDCGKVVWLTMEPSAVVEFENGRRVTLGPSKLAEVTPGMRTITVPETLSEAEVAWAWWRASGAAGGCSGIRVVSSSHTRTR